MLNAAFCIRTAYGRHRYITTIAEGDSGYTAKKRGVITKTLLVMKLTLLLLTAAFLNVSATGISQTVTYSGKNIALPVIFEEVKRQTGFVFFYDDDLIGKAKSVTVKANNEKLSSFLERIFQGQPLTYSIVNNGIIIKNKPAEHLSAPSISPSFTVPPITVRGRIVNEKGEPVSASIIVKGTKKGAMTDSYGNFEIDNVDDSEVLVISGVTIEKQEVKINGRREINITVATKISEEGEVTISTGYWSSSKRKSVMNIAKVDSRDIESQPVTNPLLALQGRVAGVDISPYNGVPGGAIKIQIRGNNSLRVNGSYPLYVVDGIPMDSRPLESGSFSVLSSGFDPLSFINPGNIESIEILKDGAATAIYGSRGANGVVRITTKKGNSKEAKLDLGVYMGIGDVSQKLDLLSTQQYVAMREEAFKNDNRPITVPGANDLLIWDTTRYTDWQKTLLGHTAKISDVAANLLGGTGKTTFRLGGGYHKESVVYPGDFGLERMNGQFALNHNSSNNKLKVTLGVNYALVKNTTFDDANFVNNALALPPNAPKLYNDDGSLNWELDAGGFSTWTNPLSFLLKTDKATTGTMTATTTVGYEILRGLNIKANMGYTDINGNETIKFPISSQSPSNINSGTTGQALFTNNKRSVWIIEPQLTYSKNFGDHNIDIVAGNTWQKSKNLIQIIQGSGYNSDAGLGNLTGAPSVLILKDELTDYRYFAFFGRIAYNYKEKYLIELTGRRDGSSRFGPGNQFGNFGGIGIGWVFTREPLMNKQSFLSFGKIRGSLASTGNDQIGDYQYYNTYSRTFNTYVGLASVHPTALFNSNFGWEKTVKMEGAIELGFFGNRVSVEAAYYRNRSSNQLVDYQLPGITGFNSILKNFNATIENRGWELVLSTNNIISKNWSWKTTFNITKPQNELLAFPGIESSSYREIYQVGQPLSISYLYTWTGVDPATGSHTFEDVDGSGALDNLDKRFINLNLRKYYGGLNNTVRFKNIELSVLFQFVKQSAAKYLPANPGQKQNQLNEVVSRWQKPGDISNVAMYTRGIVGFIDYGNLMQSDYAITDASFIRLKTLSLSYSFPGFLNGGSAISIPKIFIQGQNLLTITNYRNLDPETANGLPPLRIITLGLQINL